MIPGFTLLKDVIDEEVENQIVQALDKETWSSSLVRRTQHYGYEYNYRNKGVQKKAPEFPKAIRHVSDYLKQNNIINANQCIVNEYTIDQGISKHIDSSDFGPVVVSLSLNADTNFIFRKGDIIELIEVPRRSLLILAQEARYNWTHEIPKSKSYMIDGNKVFKDNDYRRISLTFRTVNLRN